MCQKWEGDCGLWVLNEIIKNKYAESLKKFVGALWGAKYLFQFLGDKMPNYVKHNITVNFIIQKLKNKSFSSKSI